MSRKTYSERIVYFREYYKTNKDRMKSTSLRCKRTKRQKWQEEVAGRPKPDNCEICGGLGGKKGIVWDHNHATEKFRGWICSHCNRAIGLLKDNPTTLRKLADYLEQHQ